MERDASFKNSNFIWFSILFHALLFLLFVRFPANLSKTPPKSESYYYYVPAQAVSNPSISSQLRQPISAPTPPDLSKNYDLAQFKPEPTQLFKKLQIETTSMQSTAAPQKEKSDPIRMIGEKLLDDPLRKLLGRAITGQLYYPEVARELQLRGIVSIGFMLHPDGEITEVRIVKPSREQILDNIALKAINAASPIANVDIYLKEAKYLIVSIIF